MTYADYREGDFFTIRRSVENLQAINLDSAATEAMNRPLRINDVRLGLTLAASHALFVRAVHSNAPQRTKRANHLHILEPVLPTSLKPIETRVTDIRHIQDNGWQGVALIVDDEDGVLAEERATYLQRANPQSHRGSSLFHVRLIGTDKDHATDKVIDAIADVAPTILSLIL